jgi:uncharacterized Zn finger protein
MGWYGDGYGDWAPYVSVAERRREAAKEMAALRKKGVDIQPIEITGRKIARSFWGEGWCEHLESFSDFANRLPRGRRYARNGSVCHLAMAEGKIEAKVSGSEIYDVEVDIAPLVAKKWKEIKGQCSGRIGTLLELLQGRLSDEVMAVVTHRQEGLFPLPGEMTFQCSCPDYASMCKHVAAVLYGVGSRLDSKPELLFLLRGVNQEELIQADAEQAVRAATSRGKSQRLAADQIGDVFGISLDTPAEDGANHDGDATIAPAKKPVKKAAARRTVKKRAAKAAPAAKNAAAGKAPRKKKAVRKSAKRAAKQ